jgi:protein-S-isoprenylcysteine O-methyltransferase Ste14
MIPLPEPQLLRLFLLLGLALHKGLWEIMKRKDRAPIPALRQRPQSMVKTVLKLIKVGVLAFLVFQVGFLAIFPILDEPGTLQVIGTLLYSVGLSMAIVARVQLGNNWSDLEDFAVIEKQVLITSGIYRYVRHPIYAGDLLLLTGLQLALNCWLVVCVAVPLIVVLKQTSKEEALLLKFFPGYEEYRQRSKRLIPFLL